MRETIGNIKGMELNRINVGSPLGQWFFEMLQKSVDELTVKDVSHMLRQEVYLDIAISAAWRNILENPLCGEMYDGQMLELLLRTFINHPELKEMDFYKEFQIKVQQIYKSYDWDSDYEKEEYDRLLVKLKNLYE